MRDKRWCGLGLLCLVLLSKRAAAIGGTPVLNLIKAAQPAAINAGDTAMFVIAMSNTGSGSAFNVVINDTLPAGLSWGTSTTGCSIDAGTRLLSCNVGTVNMGATPQVVVTAPTTSASCGEYSNVATATSSNGNNPTSNLAKITVGCAQLHVVKSADVPRGLPGDHLGYRTGVFNYGRGTAHGVVLTDDLPASFSWSVVPALSGCSVGSGTHLSCSFGDVPPNGGAAVHVEASGAATCGSFASAPIVTATNGPFPTQVSGAAERLAPAGDVNGNCSVLVDDVFFLVNYLFANGPSPE